MIHLSETTSQKSKSATPRAGKSGIIFLEADLLALTFDKKIIKRCDDTRLLLYYNVKRNLFYSSRNISTLLHLMQKTTNKYSSGSRLSQSSPPDIVIFGSMYSRNSICRRCSHSSWSVAVSGSHRTGSSLDEFWAPLVVMAKTVLRHFISQRLLMDGGRDVFFCPLVRSLYSPVRHADIDRGSTIWGVQIL